MPQTSSRSRGRIPGAEPSRRPPSRRSTQAEHPATAEVEADAACSGQRRQQKNEEHAHGAVAENWNAEGAENQRVEASQRRKAEEKEKKEERRQEKQNSSKQRRKEKKISKEKMMHLARQTRGKKAKVRRKTKTPQC